MGCSALLEAVKATENSTLTGVTVMGFSVTVFEIVIVNAFSAERLQEPSLLVALSVKLYAPWVVGVPVMRTDAPEGARLVPVGKPPDATAQLTFPPPNGFELQAPVALTAC